MDGCQRYAYSAVRDCHQTATQKSHKEHPLFVPRKKKEIKKRYLNESTWEYAKVKQSFSYALKSETAAAAAHEQILVNKGLRRLAAGIDSAQ